MWYNGFMPKKLIIANWKMNPSSLKEAENIWKQTLINATKAKNASVIVCMPYTYLYLAKKHKTKKIILGAQNVFTETSGGFTGQVSVSMLRDAGVSTVLVGHSEVRKDGDTNEIVNTKINLLLKNKMNAILCIGENHRDHNGFYLAYIKEQLIESLKNISKTQIKNISIAYEPIWAIGLGAVREASVDEFIEIKIFIKKILSDMYGNTIALNIPILYGGSVNPQNSKLFLAEGGASGLLVGRDSLDPKKFNLIINS